MITDGHKDGNSGWAIYPFCFRYRSGDFFLTCMFFTLKSKLKTYHQYDLSRCTQTDPKSCASNARSFIEASFWPSVTASSFKRLSGAKSILIRKRLVFICHHGVALWDHSTTWWYQLYIFSLSADTWTGTNVVLPQSFDDQQQSSISAASTLLFMNQLNRTYQWSLI